VNVHRPPANRGGSTGSCAWPAWIGLGGRRARPRGSNQLTHCGRRAAAGARPQPRARRAPGPGRHRACGFVEDPPGFPQAPQAAPPPHAARGPPAARRLPGPTQVTVWQKVEGAEAVGDRLTGDVVALPGPGAPVLAESAMRFDRSLRAVFGSMPALSAAKPLLPCLVSSFISLRTCPLWTTAAPGPIKPPRVIEPTGALRSSRSGWRAPTTRGPPRTGARTTPVLWICGKPFRFPTRPTGRHRRPASRVESRQRDVCRGQPGQRVADRRRRRARRRPADRRRCCPAWTWGSGPGGKLLCGLTGPAAPHAAVGSSTVATM